ncbi:MAG: hypothetical protein HND48_21820 [Chloroflexi bacterium]|nr:hypothetical protein [Chloroflexota bacterium]
MAHVFDADVGSLRAEVRLYRAQNVGGRLGADLDGGVGVAAVAARHGVVHPVRSALHPRRRHVGPRGRLSGVGRESVHEDYLAAGGYTIRFGDGEFGMIPPDNSVFVAIYRLNTSDNLPRHVLTRADDAPSFIQAVTNPVAATGALPPETAGSIRANAPEAFRIAHRAVKPEDYAEAVERLDWVQNAGASMRWTGELAHDFRLRRPIRRSRPHPPPRSPTWTRRSTASAKPAKTRSAARPVTPISISRSRCVPSRRRMPARSKRT